jgi:Dolichyl-phosphate-mannose-protein mannosyltransferase
LSQTVFRNLTQAQHTLIILVSLPLLLLSVSTQWLFRNCGIDPWLYFSYFLNLPTYLTQLQNSSTSYYGSRLSWLFPGYVIHQILPVIPATYVLHLTFYYAAVSSLYLILKELIGHRPALLTSLLMGCHSYFLWAIGTDYVNGAGITYCLLTLLFLTKAARSKSNWHWLVLSGFFAGAYIYSNLFLVIFVPSIGVYYLLVRNHIHNKVITSRIFVEIIYGLIGFLGITLLLGSINYALSSNFWFFLPSLRFIQNHASMSPSENPWIDPFFSWSWALWLTLPIFILINY